ncbi:hypothetical protein [uncultured Shewanella sp.]|uniref:hypothetical protein n=1 Tax=uncultured Shewanella sp. TaxID=173975 RepID=UPI00262AA9CB|nr:hypothetical protein [uncultured Shewanella sp.]
METLKLTACAFFAAFVTACGGSDPEPANTNENTGTPSPVYLTLDAMRSNQCGVLSPDVDARFLVHDSDGNILSEHQTDTDGHLEIEWTAASQHITQLTYTNPNDLDVGVTVNSYLDVTAGDLGKKIYYINNDIGCECDEVDIDISELYDNSEFQSVNFTANRSTMSVFLAPYLQDNMTKVSWCANTMTDITLLDNDGIQTKAAIRLFSQTDDQELTLSDFSEGIEVNIAPPTETSFLVAYTGFYQFRNDSWNTNQNSSNHDKPIYIYPDLDLTSMLYTHDFFSSNILDSHANINISSRQPIDDEGYTQPIELLTADESLLPEVEHIATQMRLDADTIDFDFSNYDNHISSTVLKLDNASQSYFESDNTWFIFTGREGTIPTLSLPEHIQAKFNAIEHKRVSISLRKVDRYLSLSEWRAQLAKESRSEDRANELLYLNRQLITVNFDLTTPNE